MGLGIATLGWQWGKLAPLWLDAVHLVCVHLVLGHGDHLHELPNPLRFRKLLQSATPKKTPQKICPGLVGRRWIQGGSVPASSFRRITGGAGTCVGN